MGSMGWDFPGTTTPSQAALNHAALQSGQGGNCKKMSEGFATEGTSQAARSLALVPKTREGGKRLPSSRQAGQSTSRLAGALAPPRGAQSTPGAGDTPRGAALQLRCPQNHGSALTRRHPDSAWGFVLVSLPLRQKPPRFQQRQW